MEVGFPAISSQRLIHSMERFPGAHRVRFGAQNTLFLKLASNKIKVLTPHKQMAGLTISMKG